MFFKSLLTRRNPFSTARHALQNRIDAIRDSLFSNLWDDVWYQDFPNIPTGTHKSRVYLAPYTLHVIVTPHNGIISVRVNQGDEFLGTLQTSKAGHQIIGAEGPDATETLLSALDHCAAMDQARREGRIVPEGADTTNVVSLF